jgi:hypothetical protein
MQIAMIGSGHIGGTLGAKWVVAGHDVIFGSRSPDSATALAALATTAHRAKVSSITQAITSADVVVFAIPGAAMAETTAACGQALNKRVVIDATNALGAPAPPDAGGAVAHPRFRTSPTGYDQASRPVLPPRAPSAAHPGARPADGGRSAHQSVLRLWCACAYLVSIGEHQ